MLVPLNWEELGTQQLLLSLSLWGSCEQPSQHPRQAWDGARMTGKVRGPDD